MILLKRDTCNNAPASRCPMAAAASLVSDHNISEVARQIGVGEKILLNKLNDACDRHHLNLQQAVAIGLVTGDHRILNAWAYSLGKTIIDLPDCQGMSEDELGDQILTLQAAVGDFAKALKDARQDGIITRDEFKKIQHCIQLILVASLQLNAELEQMVREAPQPTPPTTTHIRAA